jgi:hypothetical protein
MQNLAHYFLHPIFNNIRIAFDASATGLKGKSGEKQIHCRQGLDDGTCDEELRRKGQPQYSVGA